jgi:hypothetical protein
MMNKTAIVRSLAAALLGSSVLLTAAPAAAQAPETRTESSRPARGAPPTEAQHAERRERMQARMNQRLDRLAARLEIKASQQDAWNAYRSNVQSMFQDRRERPAPDADAATLLRFRADMAQRRAQHLATMADATAKLQQALDPNQRKVLDEIARSMGARGKHRGHGQRHHRGGEQRDRHGRA